MEIILAILAWGFQIVITVLIAVLLGILIKAAERTIRRNTVKLLPRSLVVLVLLCTLLASLALKPPVVCPEEYRDDLTAEMREAVQSQSRGLYSANLPLVPAFVEITSTNRTTVTYNINYLYFGRVKMSYSTSDGYNRENPWS